MTTLATLRLNESYWYPPNATYVPTDEELTQLNESTGHWFAKKKHQSGWTEIRRIK